MSMEPYELLIVGHFVGNKTKSSYTESGRKAEGWWAQVVGTGSLGVAGWQES